MRVEHARLLGGQIAVDFDVDRVEVAGVVVTTDIIGVWVTNRSRGPALFTLRQPLAGRRVTVTPIPPGTVDHYTPIRPAVDGLSDDLEVSLSMLRP